MQGREDVTANFAAILDLTTVRLSFEPLATRGERFVLGRWTFQDATGESIFEVEVLNVHEIDAEGRHKLAVSFDPDDLDAALAELDAQYAASSRPPDLRENAAFLRFEESTRTAAAGDWDTFRLLLHPDVVLEDRRSGLAVEARGADEITRLLQIATPPGLTTRSEVIALRGDDLALFRCGRAPQGFEIAWLNLTELAEDGSILYNVMFDESDRDAAFAELEQRNERRSSPVAGTATGPIPNRCVRVLEGLLACWNRGAIDDYAALVAPDARGEDRRAGLGAEMVGPEGYVANFEASHAVGATDASFDLVATRGETLALIRTTFATAGEESFTAEIFEVNEIDETGLLCRTDVFDANDLPTAVRELDDRYLDGGHAGPVEGLVVKVTRAYNDWDIDAGRALSAEDFLYIDHAPASAGEIRGVDSWIAYHQQMVSLAPTLFRLNESIEAKGPVAFWTTRAYGTDEFGGAFERRQIAVGVVESDRLLRLEMFPTEDIDRARARYEELAADPSLGLALTVDLLENECVRVKRVSDALHVSGRLEEFAATFAEPCFHQDRRPMFRGDNLATRRSLVRIGQAMLDVGTERIDLAVVATRGERLALVRRMFRARKNGGFEVEVLNVVQLDEHGLIEADIAFERDSLDEAFDELDRRWLAISPSDELIGAGIEFVAAYNAQDWDRIAVLLHPECVMVDHRPAGFDDADQSAIVERSRAFAEQVGEFRWRIVKTYEIEGATALIATSREGTDEHGNVLRWDLLFTGAMRDGRLVIVDTYDRTQFDEAWSRARELLDRQI